MTRLDMLTAAALSGLAAHPRAWSVEDVAARAVEMAKAADAKLPPEPVIVDVAPRAVDDRPTVTKAKGPKG